MEEFNIDQYLEQYFPYLVCIRCVDNYHIVDVQIPTLWDVGKLTETLSEDEKKLQTLVTSEDKTGKVISIIGTKKYHPFSVLFNRIGTIIKINLERESKNLLFKETVKKLEKLFINTDLDKLQNIVIDVPEPLNEDVVVGNSDNINLPPNDNNDEEEDGKTD
jgi:hypothetical protein